MPVQRGEQTVYIRHIIVQMRANTDGWATRRHVDIIGGQRLDQTRGHAARRGDADEVTGAVLARRMGLTTPGRLVGDVVGQTAQAFLNLAEAPIQQLRHRRTGHG